MKQTELIIFLVVVAINGGIALWKKMKEREAAAQAARSQQRPAAQGSAPRTTAPAQPSAAARTQIDARIRARAEARKAPRRPSAPEATPVARPSAPAVAAAPKRPNAARGVHHGRPAGGHAVLPGSVTRLRQAVAAAEILGPPRSLRPWSPADAGR